MFSIFSYGSLMHPEDIEDMFGSDVNCTPCILDGFKRHYGQRSEWRTDENGNYGGVMTVHPDNHSYDDKSSFCNGILIERISDDLYDLYKEREHGYELLCVEPSSVSGFNGRSVNHTERVVVPIGAWTMNSWNPIESYTKHCQNGAKYWGEKFFDVFCETTYKTLFSEETPHPV